MEIIKLKLFEVLQLENEINGLKKTETGQIVIKGLLNEKIKLTTRYWLNQLGDTLVSEKEMIDTLREKTILQYGTSDGEGNVVIQTYIDEVDGEGNVIMVTDHNGKTEPNKVINPKFIEFQNELNGLYNQEKEIEYNPFKLEEFNDVVGEYDYRIIFKLIKKEGTN